MKRKGKRSEGWRRRRRRSGIFIETAVSSRLAEAGHVLVVHH